MRVIIIGAGLGGLTLAHGLRADGIDTAVYERSPRTGPQPPSYGIHVNAHGNRALHACLPTENWAAFDDSTVSAPDVVRFRGPSLRVLTDLAPGASAAESADPVLHRRAVRRQALHRSLIMGLDDDIEWDKTFERYAHQPDGRVRVEFADGSHTIGDLLVGADGSNSRVRRQYLPHLVRHELGILTIAGHLPLDHHAAQALPTDMIDGSVNNVVPPEPGWMFASTWPASGRPDSNATLPSSDEDFLVWAYAAARSAYPDDVESFSPERLQHLVTARVAGWDLRIADMVEASDPATVAPVALRSMSTLPAWQASNVTLLGDAIHNMTPMAGIGANTALRDADGLRRVLAEPGPTTLTERVERYEQHMRGYANEALALSTRNANNAASDKRLPRMAFRTLLRVADAVAPVKRAVFPVTAQPASSS
jgi:2-polyprenyl-6-methoxyphenol hydroxylase-like FAD-dependent oxidoreductase